MASVEFSDIQFHSVQRLVISLSDVQGEKGAHVLVVPELVDFLTSALDKVMILYSRHITFCL